jgi:nucleoside-diphosphate-sugar epimerase
LLLPIEAKDKHACIIYAEDIARLYAELLFNENAFGQAYTLGSQEPTTWGEMADIYKEICGIETEWINGMDFAKMSLGNPEKISEGMRFMLYYDRFFNRDVNVDKVLQVTGIKAESFISHKEGLKKCFFANEEKYPVTQWDIDQNNFMDEYIKNKGL